MAIIVQGITDLLTGAVPGASRVMPEREKVAAGIATQAGVPNNAETLELADRALARCTKLVERSREPIPDVEVLAGLVDVGAELLFRKRARNGVVVLGEDSQGGLETTRVAGDPTAPARKAWATWLGPGIG